jgi:hypothetical protein
MALAQRNSRLSEWIFNEVEDAAEVVDVLLLLVWTARLSGLAARSGNVALLGVGGDGQQGHTEPVDVLVGTSVRAAGVAATDAHVVAAPGQDVVVPAAPVVPERTISC